MKTIAATCFDSIKSAQALPPLKRPSKPKSWFALGTAALVIAGGLIQAAPSVTGFSYQGRLAERGMPAEGIYDVRFALYDAATAGSQVGTAMTNAAVPVTEGLFATTLDFGAGVFNGQARWLEIAVRTNGGGAFVPLTPRQALQPAPESMYAGSAGTANSATTALTANSVAAPNISGTLTIGQMPGGLLTNNQSGVSLGGAFAGNGAGLTNINAAGLSGTLSDSRLSGNVARTNQVWLLGGNAGTTAGAQFLGTTDNQPLELRVGGTPALRIEPQAGELPNLVGGHTNNTVSARSSAILGGRWNSIEGDLIDSLIGGGWYNTIQSNASYSFIGQGYNNAVQTNAQGAVIGGGMHHRILPGATLGVIGGGYANTNGAPYAVVPGGYYNAALGTNSFAAGRRAKANHDGTFVWADFRNADFGSTASNQFLIRAANGVGINTNNPQAALHVAGNIMASNFVGSGVGLTTLSGGALMPGSVTAVAIAPGAVSALGAPDGSPTNALVVDTNGLVGIGTNTPRAGLEIAGGASIVAPQVLFERIDEAAGFTNLAGACSIAAFGNLIAVAGSGDDGLTILEVSNPQAPILRSSFRTVEGAFSNMGIAYGDPAAVAMKTNLLVVAAGEDSTVTLIGLTNPAAPVKLAQLRDGVGGWNELGGAWAVAVSGNLLAIGAEGDSAVTLADISNPSAPIKRAELKNGQFGYTNLNSVQAVALSGNLLAIGGYYDNAVTLVNVANPASPVKLAELKDGVNGFNGLMSVTSVALSGNLLAIAGLDDQAVTLVNVANPSNPVKLAEWREGQGGINSLTGVRSVAFGGTWLAASALDDGAVTLFDVSDAANPRVAAVLHDGVAGFNALNGAMGMAFSGGTLAIAGMYDSGLTLAGLTPATVGLVSQQRVGIGTEQPAAPLHVVGNVIVENAGLFDINADRVELGDSAATGSFATAMGSQSTAGGFASTAMGSATTASGYASTAFGHETTASGDYSTAFGNRTVASGPLSMAMGYQTTASGRESLAAGRLAQANHQGAFVWADVSSWDDFASTGDNQFLIRANGGVGINKNNPATALDVNGVITGGGLTLTGSGRLNDNDVFFRTGADALHGLGWYGGTKLFAGANVNGPVLYGNGGGALGARSSTTNIALQWDGSGNVILPGTLTAAGTVQFTGSAYLNDKDLRLRNDGNHGLGWYGTTKTFATQSPDGPVLYGFSGGGLGTLNGGQKFGLTWDFNGKVAVDPASLNAGTLTPGLTFGYGSGEGIASKRTAGGNQYGLDLYTGFSPRLSIDSSGRVGIGTTAPSDSTLDVRGDIRLNDCRLLLRSGTDRNHALGWTQLSAWQSTFTGDGPALYGHTGGVLGTTTGGNAATLIWLSNGNVWVRNTVYGGSDRAIKDEFGSIDSSDVLEKVAAMPLQTWHYKTEESGVRHLGPVAQDFYSAFGLGLDDKHIATVDADGVALAAIQGLNRKLNDELARRDAENTALKQRLERIEQLLAKEMEANH